MWISSRKVTEEEAVLSLISALLEEEAGAPETKKG